MTEIANSETSEKQKSAKKSLLSYWWAPLGTIILGAIGSGVWDILAKPGLSSLGRLFLNMLSFGSTRVRDYAYENAALDPYPLPSMLLSGALVGAMILMGVIFIFISFAAFKPRTQVVNFIQNNDTEKATKKDSQDERKIILLQLRARRRLLGSIMLMIGLLIMEIYVSLAYSVAISIRRFFEANVLICAPVMSSQEEKRIRAQFAWIKTKSDYETVDASLRSLCEPRGVRLRELSLW